MGVKEKLSCFKKKPVQIGIATVVVGFIIGMTIGGIYIYDHYQKETVIPPHSDAPCLSSTTIWHAEEISRKMCVDKGCIWIPNDDDAPRCFFPPASTHGYSRQDAKRDKTLMDSSAIIKMKPTSAKIVDDLVEKLEVKVITYTENIFRITVKPVDGERYKVPVPLNLPSATELNNTSYNVSLFDLQDNFAIKVTRVSSGISIFDTSIGGFTFADQYLQIATRLPSENLYGLGENTHLSFKHDLNYITWPMFARDQPPGAIGQNLYGVHPMYLVVENDGRSHAFLWLNSNAMEAETMPLPGLTLRSIGGIMDLLFFMGPTPQEAIQQYTEVIGRPFLPPYWSLGFQLSRYGYDSLDNMKEAVSRTRQSGIPLDVQYADIDHFDRRLDFTYDNISFNGLPEYIEKLKSDNISFIIILDPAINAELGKDYPVHQRAVDNSVYIVWPDDQSPSSNFGAGNITLGYVWPYNRTAFPDFFKESTKDWWMNEIIQHYKTLKFDGLWIDMNEPANFGTNENKPWNWPEGRDPWSLHCPNSSYDDPPYITAAASVWGEQKRLSDKTLCMSTLQGETNQFRHYDVHNLYGWSETEPTLKALQNVTSKRGLVITRSTYPSSGRWAGHWLGDNTAAWEHLHQSIIGMMEFNLFGIPYIGADICGFFGDTTEELCERWMELGAFYPYSRNHNNLGAMDHDPGQWPTVAASSRAALQIRYKLLPYLYTLHYLASTKGDTVIRPLVFEFPESIKAQSIDKQFLWGSWLMIAPVLDEGSTSVRVYFPKGVWYEYHSGTVIANTIGVTLVIHAPRSHIPVYVRGGGILPTQRPRMNTALSRNEPLGLIVAPDLEGKASGTFYWDDGDSINPVGSKSFFTANMTYVNDTITWQVTHPWNGVNLPRISDFRVFSVTQRPAYLIVNGKRWSKGDWHYDSNSQALEIFDLEIPIERDFTLSWKYNMDLRIPCPFSYADWNEAVNVTKDLCDKRNCSWDVAHEVKCSINNSSSSYGYVFATDGVIQTEKGFRAELRKIGPTLFGADVEQITFEVFQYSDDTLRFKFYQSNKARYEVPLQLNLPTKGTQNPLYDIVYPTPKKGNPFYFYVVRKDTGNILFDTRIGGLTFSNQFLSLTTMLPSKNIYGLGENTHTSFRHDLSQKTWPIFSRDQPPEVDDQQRNLYGAHPYYQCVENDGKAHGVLLLNSNAMDYQMLDYPAITYRTIGGILDFFMVLGPKPETVVSQYTNLIQRPLLPPYWSLGFQLSRYGYENLSDLQGAVNRTRAAGVPQDVQYGDIDYMDRRLSFTYDNASFKGFPEYISAVKDEGLRFIVILDPAINAKMSAADYPIHERALKADAYIKWENGTDPAVVEGNNNSNGTHSYMLGYVWPDDKTAFPSFFKKKSQDWWIEEIRQFYETIKFDGLWIDMNEPANFGTNEEKPWNWPEGVSAWSLKCPFSEWDDPPYVTKAGFWSKRMSDKTLCLAAVEDRDNSGVPYRHYDVHNLYGWAQTQPTYEAAQSTTGKRSLVVSRSTFPGSGRWAGHWLGDNRSEWPDMKRSIIGMLEFNLFGIPYIGADICGFFGNAAEDLCERWMELGAFYPYSRNHNHKDASNQDPGHWDKVAISSKKALEVRYRLLPYLYTLFYHAHVDGNTVIRAILHEFPTDRRTLALDDQFLWGPAFMISPILEQGQNERKVYFTYDAWYDYYTGKAVDWIGDYVAIPAPNDTIPLHIRGGYILPTQRPAMNTQSSRKEPMGIIVAIGLNRKAFGDLFWDDGESQNTIGNKTYGMLQFSFIQDTLTMKVVQNGNEALTGLQLMDVEFLGVELKPKTIYYNQTPLTNFTYNETNKKLEITLKHNLTEELEIKLEKIWHHTVAM